MEEKKLWYVVNAYSGHEQKVKDYLESRRESMGMEITYLELLSQKELKLKLKME